VKITTLDIETINNWQPERPRLLPTLSKGAATSIRPIWEPADDFAPLALHEPVVIVWLDFDSDNMTLDLHIYRKVDGCPDVEADALFALSQSLRKAHRVVTWNGRGFDMPLLNIRALVHRVNWAFWQNMNHRYANFKKDLVHYDLMDLLGDQGGARGIGFDHVRALLGFAGKYDMHGGDVKDIWPTDPDRVVTYCVEDVWELWLTYLRWLEVFKCLSQAHVDRVTSWWETSMSWAHDQPELERWRGASSVSHLRPEVAALDEAHRQLDRLPLDDDVRDIMAAFARLRAGLLSDEKGDENDS